MLLKVRMCQILLCDFIQMQNNALTKGLNKLNCQKYDNTWSANDRKH